MKNTSIVEKSKAHFDATAANYDASSDGQFTEKMYAPLIAELRKSAGGKLLSIRSSDIAFTMGAKGPLLEKEKRFDGEIEVY